MPYTLVFEASRIVFCESSDDWDEAQQPPEGLVVVPYLAVDATGQRLNGPRRIVNDVAEPVSLEDFHAAQKDLDHRHRQRALTDDKVMRNAVLRTTRRLQRASMRAIGSGLATALDSLQTLLNAKLPAGAKITNAEWRVVTKPFADAVQAAMITPEQTRDVWNHTVATLTADLDVDGPDEGV